MGQVKSSIPETQSSIDDVIDDVASKLAQKNLDLEDEKGNEKRNAQSVAKLQTALNHLKAAKAELEEYKKI